MAAMQKQACSWSACGAAMSETISILLMKGFVKRRAR
jgi:hypothetical protein